MEELSEIYMLGMMLGKRGKERKKKESTVFFKKTRNKVKTRLLLGLTPTLRILTDINKEDCSFSFELYKSQFKFTTF